MSEDEQSLCRRRVQPPSAKSALRSSEGFRPCQVYPWPVRSGRRSKSLPNAGAQAPAFDDIELLLALELLHNREPIWPNSVGPARDPQAAKLPCRDQSENDIPSRSKPPTAMLVCVCKPHPGQSPHHGVFGEHVGGRRTPWTLRTRGKGADDERTRKGATAPTRARQPSDATPHERGRLPRPPWRPMPLHATPEEVGKVAIEGAPPPGGPQRRPMPPLPISFGRMFEPPLAGRARAPLIDLSRRSCKSLPAFGRIFDSPCGLPRPPLENPPELTPPPAYPISTSRPA